jgi:hypothetical protein
MKASAFWLPVVCAIFIASPAAAQHGGRGNALGGGFASRGAMTHPLGGFTPTNPGIGVNRGFRGNQAAVGRRPYIYPYGYSYYVPNYFDYLDADSYTDPYGYAAYGYGPTAPAAPPYASVAASAPSQPVIINQYFGMPAGAPQQGNGPESIRDTQGAAGNLLGAAQNYYLIAYKNHEVYPALAYWVEDKTLHYVTTQNTHNQASMDLIDVTLTKSLNQARDVPFALAGQ